jgi:signal transduction histidine kinase
VPVERREEAFAPLYSTKGGDHLGLGLAVIRALVSRHGGQVSLASGADGGTTLLLRLPSAGA